MVLETCVELVYVNNLVIKLSSCGNANPIGLSAVGMACQRCHWYSGRRVNTGGGVGLGHCQMAAAAAKRMPFDGVVVQCALCNQSGCLSCVQSLSKELSAWLNSGNGMGYSIAAQNNEEACRWNDLLMLPFQSPSGRTWSSKAKNLVVFN